jgi:hypothetical protein
MVDRLPKEKNWILHHHMELKANSLQKDPIGVKIKKYKMGRVWGGKEGPHYEQNWET